MGAFLDGDWESLCKLFTVDDSPHLSSNLLEYSSPVSDQDDDLRFPLLSHFNQNSFSSINDWVSNPAHSHLHTETTDDHSNSSRSSDQNCAADNFFSNEILSCIDFSMVNGEIDGFSTPSFNTIVHSHNHNHNSNNSLSSADKLSPNTDLSLKRKRDVPVIQDGLMDMPPKKNARASKEVTKKKRKTNQKSDDEITATVNIKDSNETADSNTEDDSNNVCASEEINETEDSNSNLTAVSLTSTGKKRANRGAATDPQSLYARKRRMRINERLKILQTLVPNGTKVDISTMLEEAFHYVKFLQLQIRLLSSDEMWMYAPLAYNGFDVGAYRRMPPISPFLGV